jgi:hypothetical protein
MVEDMIANRRSLGTHEGHPYKLSVEVPFMGTLPRFYQDLCTGASCA